ncbi:DUF2336 domain-containing protein [Rhizobium sp. CSW-27]|uniref:DUF2336 domain-containing protein n=1 Tax=Rhizobium sp. CSW-27 TaxID=2839985 RepID=UPI001C0109C0|nr:DUF2336 domain-containing protein [Rhizobium sp. CSW-27]MBT9370123.1 DUF2336 domain-containing protein [Rhizobium sp. CSW-27]
MAMIHLLDDPDARVRRALAEALATSPAAPRPVVLALAQDQPDVACHVLTLSPVLAQSDLVDLVGRGGRMLRGLVAARPGLGPGAAAAIAEVGEAADIRILLDNPRATITRYALQRIAERFGACPEIRAVLADRADLPLVARDILVRCLTQSLGQSSLLVNLLDPARLAHVLRETDCCTTLQMAAECSPTERQKLVEHLVANDRIDSIFLLRALVGGEIEVLAACMCALSGLGEERVRAVLATGRHHALRALYEACGLAREVAHVFVEATLLWRKMAAEPAMPPEFSLSAELRTQIAPPADPYAPVSELLALVEQMETSARRQQARHLSQTLRSVA